MHEYKAILQQQQFLAPQNSASSSSYVTPNNIPYTLTLTDFTHEHVPQTHHPSTTGQAPATVLHYWKMSLYCITL